MGAIYSFFEKKDPRTPVKGCRPRIKNIAILHFRGILGTLVPIAFLSWQLEKGRLDLTVTCLWVIMFWCMLIQPIAVPASGYLPLFMLPMLGVASTVVVAGHYFNDTICLYILGGMLHLLINTSFLDRRIILWLLCSGDSCQFSGKRIIFKASTAAFFLSMFSNRLIVTSTITQFLTTGYMNLQSSTSRNRKGEPDYDEMRYIVLNAVQSASSIGSITILHAALTTITMKAIWTSNCGEKREYEDIFNYMQYICFAFPVAFFMFIFNFLYHMSLINVVIGKPMTGSSMTEMRNFLLKQKETLPPISFFEKETLFFYILFLALCIFRWCDWLGQGWSSFKTVVPEVPMIKDATVAAIFLVCLSILPRKLTLWKYIVARKKSELGVLKTESAVLWWRFVDKNINYGYVILIGGAVALNAAIQSSGLGKIITENSGKFFTEKPWNLSIFLVCLISVFLANIMSGIGACCIFLPYVLNMALEGVAEVWLKRVHLGALGVGVGTSMGFTSPFLYTPAYFCHYTGKVPLRKMVLGFSMYLEMLCCLIYMYAMGSLFLSETLYGYTPHPRRRKCQSPHNSVKDLIKYGIFSAIICLIILWLALCFYAPIIWDPSGEGIKSFTLETTPADKKAPD